ncbi:hypothetical protein M5689_022001 [Euphorbia peplus]|nr:hypothetical protein M5689_022001 [Euphorbia peplus]
MESDLSLIEISREDDSLLSLQQSSPIVVSNNYNTPYFSSSPLLQIPRSRHPTPRSIDKPTSSSLCKDIKDHYKENVNANKSEAPKLSVEPQSMKKKKKAAGFNLRKSLAWDRAFFTDEGVLDPLELSVLSGNVLSEGSKVAGKMSPKLMYSAKAKMHPPSPISMKGTKLSTITEPCPQTKRKVLSAHDINRSSSKRSGCPRSLVSSSLKRTSNTNVIAKEPRVSKQLDTKNEPLVVSQTSRSSVTGASHTKRNFASQPATGQKNIVIKGLSTSAKSCRNDAKPGPSGKLIRKSTVQPARSMLKVAAEQEMHSSTGSQPPKVSLENNSSEGLPDAVVPAAADPLNGHDSTSNKHASSLRQTTCYYGENKQHAQTQIAKPSGLRMPSPSLGFFGQSKSSNSHGELQKGLPSCNFPKDCIPTVSKATVLNSIQKRPRPSRKIPPCSVNSEQQLSTVDLTSCDDGDPCEKIERLSCIENIGLQINDIKLPPRRDPCEQLEKHDGKSVVDVCPRSRDSPGARLGLPHSVSPIPLFVEVEGPFETNNTFIKQHAEDRKCKQSMKNSSVSPESHTASMHNDPDHISSQVHGEKLTGLDEFKPSPKQAELKKPGTCKVDPISEILSQRLNETLPENCGLSEKGVKDYSSNAEDNVPGVQDCGTVSYCPPHSTEAERRKDETTGTDCLNGGLHVGEVQMPVESTLLVSSCMSSTYTSPADLNWMILGSPSAEFAKRTKIQNSCSVAEQVAWNNCEPPSKVCLQFGKCSEAGPFKTNDTLAKQVEERKCRSSIKSYSVSQQSHTESTEKIDSEVDGEQLNGLDEFELSPRQAAPKKPVTCRIGSISDMRSQRCSGTLMRDCTSPEKGNRTEISNAVDYILEVQDQSAVSYGPTTEAEPTKDETSEADCLNGGLPVEEVETLPVEAPLSVVSCKSSTNSVADANFIICESPSERSAQQTEVLTSCFVTEQISQKNCEAPSKGCSEEYPQKNVLQSVNIAESRASGVFCSLTSVNQDCNFVANEKMNVENASVDNEPSVGNFRHNVELCGEADALKLDTIHKSDITGEIITNTVGEEKYCLNSGGDIGSKYENSDVISNISCRRVDVASVMNNPSEENLFSELQPQASYSPEKTAVVFYSDCSTDMIGMREHDEEHAKLISSCSNEVEQVNEDCQLRDDTLCDQDGLPEDVSCIHRCGFEISHIPRKMDEVGANTAKELLHEDASVQEVIYESSLADSNNRNVDNSAENQRSLLVVDKSRQDAELVIEQVPLENAGLCSDDNLLLVNTSIESKGKDRELDSQSCPFNLGSSSNSDSYQISSVANDGSGCSSLNENIKGTSSGSSNQNVQEPYTSILPSEDINENNDSFGSELIDRLCSDVATLSLNKRVEENKQDTPVIKPPPNAIPFSDEWLAALEAAGEEILARKGGAVQNSPTDKSSPPPNPWSPVKRKNNQGLGPFDCTKFINPTD